jgi:ELWxxDGT repeat protein
MPFQGGALLLPSDQADMAQLWRSDGTPAGTVPFFSFSPGSGRSFYTLFPPVGPVQLAVVQHQDGQHRSFEIWRTDGSARGTRPLLQLDPRQVLYLDTAAWDGKVLFNVGDPDGCAFWSSDGTAAGTRQILPPMPKLDCPSAKIAFGSRFVFVAAVGARPDHRTPQIFISDGTAAGTHQLTALQKIVSPVFEDRPVVVGGIVFLRLNDAFGHPEIWRTDGTPGRTRRAFPLTDADNLFAFGASLYFTALLADGSGSSGVFRASSSDRSPTLLATVDQMEVDSGTVSFTPLGDQLVFAAGDPDLGSELWSTDGTPAGTRLLADVDPGPRSSMPTGFVPAGDRVFFSADDGTHGLELWETDGTTEGTRRRTDIAPGGFSSLLRYSNPVVSNGFVFFNADDAVTGAEPWALPLEPR